MKRKTIDLNGGEKGPGYQRRTSMSGKTVSLTMTVRELDAVAFACLREHAKLGLLRRSQPELKGLEEAYALYSGLLSEMLALQKEFSEEGK